MPEPPSRGGHEFGRGLARALQSTGIAVVYRDRDLNVVWAENVPSTWAARRVETGSALLPETLRERSSALVRRILEQGGQEKLEFFDDELKRWFEVWIDADLDDKAAVTGTVTTLVDITERKQREQTLRVLLREVSHRSKNLLSIILSIAGQTGRHSRSVGEFLGRFRGRVQSLAASQDLVTSSNWRGATLSELVDGQVGRYCDRSDQAVHFEGVDAYLDPNAALHVGLALHELVVNSITHGALARPGGSARVRAELVERKEEGEMLAISWTEDTKLRSIVKGGRFGSLALERAVPLSVDGKAEFTVKDGKLEYRLEIPSKSFEID